jgi:hypothetical protein
MIIGSLSLIDPVYSLIWITENYQDSRHVASEDQLWYVAQLAEMETR